MLRHLGLERRRIGSLLAAEGGVTALAGVAAGVAGGFAIAAILIYVINRQSFHWSMDPAVPWTMIGAFALAGTGGTRRAAGRCARDAP